MSYHECHIFHGKRKILPLPLWPILVSAPFQQWGLYFVGEIHPPSKSQRKWILTATYYFRKWIEAISTMKAIDSVFIQFIESNILPRFGYLQKIITDNYVSFKSKNVVDFCEKYHITLGNSIAYYPQGNGMVEYSNKSLINIINKVLELNRKNWHKNIINALWVNKVSNKKSIGMSPFQLVYGVDTIFPSSLSIPVVKILQEVGNEPNDVQ